MNKKIINEFVEDVNGVIKKITGDVPKFTNNGYSETNKIGSDEIADAISVKGMSPWGSSIGLGYITGPIFEGVEEQVLPKKVSALDLLTIDEDAPSGENDDSEYVERTKYFTEIFNDFFDNEEKVKALRILFDRLHISDVDDKYKKSLVNHFREKIYS